MGPKYVLFLYFHSLVHKNIVGLTKFGIKQCHTQWLKVQVINFLKVINLLKVINFLKEINFCLVEGAVQKICIHFVIVHIFL